MTAFARLNIRCGNLDDAASLELQALLGCAATEGSADEHEVFRDGTVSGVSVPCDLGSALSLLQAGSVLGFVLSRYERWVGTQPVLAHDGGTAWMSLHNAADKVLASPV